MAKTLSKAGILTGADILAGHVTQSVDAFTGIEAYNITISGSTTISGSLLLEGTTDTNQPFVLTYNTSSGQVHYTASSATGGGISPTQTGSFMVTGSVTDNTLTFTKGDGSTFPLTIDTGSGGGGGDGTDIAFTYYVSPSGSDVTGEVGNWHKPFQTISGSVQQAVADATAGGYSTTSSVIYVNPGQYVEQALAYNGNFYFAAGAKLSPPVQAYADAVPFFSVGSNGVDEVKIFGNAEFIVQATTDADANSKILYASGTGSAYLECYKIDVEDAYAIFAVDDSTVLMQGKEISYPASSGYMVSARDNSNVTLNFDKIFFNGTGTFTYMWYCRQGSTSNWTGKMIVNAREVTQVDGYGLLLLNASGSENYMNVDNFILSGSTTAAIATNGTDGDAFVNWKGNISNYNVPLFANFAPGSGRNQFILDGTMKAFMSTNTPITINGGANDEITLDMWIESSGSNPVISLNNGTAYLNKSLYNTQNGGNGVNVTGGTLEIDTYKIITTGSGYSISGTSQDVIINNTLSSNVSASSGITFIGPGTYMSNQTGQIINTSISASGNLFASASDDSTIGHVALYNTSSGQFFYTASNAVGIVIDPKYQVYETGSGTDSIKPSHGNGNVSSGTRSTVAGGANNEATNGNTFVGGGEENCALQNKSAVLGGEKNKACQGYTVAGGGFSNTANGCLSGVWSGCVNTAGGDSSAILGGRNNEASGDCSTVVGGQSNCAQKTHDFIGGGCCNKTANSGVSSFNSILGGELNEILDELGNSTSHSTIGGGECNQIDADHAVIGGGCKNYIGGVALNPEASTIGGGHNNFISSSASTIAGGEGNHINLASECSFIGGGHQNKVDINSQNSVIGGGTQNNIATTTDCGGILGGQRNKLQHDKSFIVGSNLTSSAVCTTFMNNAIIEGNLSASGHISASYFVGDGSSLTNINYQRPISNSISTDMTASNSNAGYYFRTGGNITCSIQTNAAVPCDIGSEFDFIQTSSAGNMLFLSGSGVTLNTKNGFTKLDGQFAGATLKKVDTDEWDLVGDLNS
jgi:hypothetical protein